MPCYGPRTGYFSKDVNPETGNRPLVFDIRDAFSGVPVRVPCGECIGCLRDRAQEWATRCTHELRMYSANAFVTLTYNDQSLPAHASLAKRDVQLFMKRLRKRRPEGLRFFACGEYGETTLRPHYHILLFNTHFQDQKFWKNARGGSALSRSEELNSLWPQGDHYIGEVTPASCKYTALYMTKSLLKRRIGYGSREPEFRLMSRNPGLGRWWFDKFYDESYNHDNCVVDSQLTRLPRYYDVLLDRVDPTRLVVVKRARRQTLMSPQSRAERTHDRRLVREKREYLLLERYARDNE